MDIEIILNKDQDKEKEIKTYKKNIECKNNVIDLTKNICIVDLSYMTFTRFFAIRRWYEIKMKTDKPEWKIPDNYNWMEDNIFMDKFNKLFFEKLFELCNKRNIPLHNIIFATDCNHCQNWRLIYLSSYKETRKESHIRNKFHNFDIFPYVRVNLLGELQEESRNIILKDDNLEADDLIALTIEYLKSKNYNNLITIIANDKDYIQICNSNIDCCDLTGKSLSNRILNEFTNASEYLIYKILFGDISDNLLPCYLSNKFIKEAEIKTKKDFIKASPSNIKKIFASNNCKKLLIDYLEYSRDVNIMSLEELIIKWNNKIKIFEIITKDKQFEKNAKMIDFQNIPNEFKSRTFSLLQQLF